MWMNCPVFEPGLFQPCITLIGVEWPVAELHSHSVTSLKLSSSRKLLSGWGVMLTSLFSWHQARIAGREGQKTKKESTEKQGEILARVYWCWTEVKRITKYLRWWGDTSGLSVYHLGRSSRERLAVCQCRTGDTVLNKHSQPLQDLKSRTQWSARFPFYPSNKTRNPKWDNEERRQQIFW